MVSNFACIVNKTVSMIQERQEQTDLELEGLDVEDVAFLTAIAVSRALELLMGCKLRVSQEPGSIAVEQILGSMDSSTETTRPPGHRALLSGHLDKP
ncbi:hypothetical protein GH733_017957, partial [Mirounga leonina]